jgi:hypothetical protein
MAVVGHSVTGAVVDFLGQNHTQGSAACNWHHWNGHRLDADILAGCWLGVCMGSPQHPGTGCGAGAAQDNRFQVCWSQEKASQVHQTDADHHLQVRLD